jgi:hypothetical protein
VEPLEEPAPLLEPLLDAPEELPDEPPEPSLLPPSEGPTVVPPQAISTVTNRTRVRDLADAMGWETARRGAAVRCQRRYTVAWPPESRAKKECKGDYRAGPSG